MGYMREGEAMIICPRACVPRTCAYHQWRMLFQVHKKDITLHKCICCAWYQYHISHKNLASPGGNFLHCPKLNWRQGSCRDSFSIIQRWFCGMVATFFLGKRAMESPEGPWSDHLFWGYTVKNIPTEIQSLKLTEFKLIYVAFQVGTDFQQPALTEIFYSVQLFSNWICDFSQVWLNLSWCIFYSVGPILLAFTVHLLRKPPLSQSGLSTG